MKYLKLILVFSSLQIMSGISFAENAINGAQPAQNPFEMMPFALPKSESNLYSDYRTKWTRLTGFEYSGLHWQQFVSIYVNKGADTYRDNYLAYLSLYRDDEDEDEDEKAEQANTFKEYDLGTIFLKENYLSKAGQPGTPSSLTIMIKREEGYDQAGGNWEYIQTDTQGNVLMQGSSQSAVIKQVCSECHSNMAERDYVFSTFLTSQPGH